MTELKTEKMKESKSNKNTPEIPACLKWLFPYKIKALPIAVKSAVMYYFFQNKITLTIINWLFQGMRGMDKTDFAGKIVLEIICAALVVLIWDVPLLYKVPLALVFGHTVNWLFNTHFWVFGRFLGITHTDPKRFFPYIQRVVARVNKNKSVPMVIVIGSISRNQNFKVTSDVDIMFIRGKGIQNGVKAAIVTLRERTMALLLKFPLHLEFYDSIESMKKHRSDEVPVVLKDVDGTARDWYAQEGMDISSLDDCSNSV